MLDRRQKGVSPSPAWLPVTLIQQAGEAGSRDFIVAHLWSGHSEPSDPDGLAVNIFPAAIIFY